MKPWELNWSKPEQQTVPKEAFSLKNQPAPSPQLVGGEAKPIPRSSTMEAGLGGFVKGATLGLSDLVSALSQLSPNIQYSPSVVKGKIQEQQKQTKKLKEEHPIAFGAGEIASYLTPGSAPSTIFKGAGKVATKAVAKTALKGVGQKLTKGAIESGIGMATTEGLETLIEGKGLASAGQEALKSGIIGAATAPMLALAGAAIRKQGENVLRGKLGAKANDKVIKNIIDENLQGSVKSIAKNTQKMRNELGNELGNILKSASNKRVNIRQAIEETRTNLLNNEQLVSAIGEDGINRILNRAAQNTKNVLTVNPEIANNIKRGWGQNAQAWDKFLTPKERNVKSVWNSLYQNLAEKIHTTVPETQVIDKKLSKIITINDIATKAMNRGPSKLNQSIDLLIGLGAIPAGIFTGGAGTVGTLGLLAGKKALQAPETYFTAQKALQSPLTTRAVSGAIQKVKSKEQAAKKPWEMEWK